MKIALLFLLQKCYNFYKAKGIMNTKACIFDFDGVVIDSEKYHHLAWQWIAQDIGASFSYDEYAPFKSAGRQKVIPYLFEKAGREMLDGDMEKYCRMREEKIGTALSMLSENDIMDGVEDFVRLLKANGILCAVASASTSSHIVAKRFGIFDMFDAFVDGEAKLPHKPNPDIFLRAACLLGVLPSQCVVFEDSVNGITGAKNAGMHCIGVQTYFTDKADRVIDSFVGADLSLIDF